MNEMFNNYEKRREDEHADQDELEGIACENCGVVTQKITCSKSCYNIMEAEYALD